MPCRIESHDLVRLGRHAVDLHARRTNRHPGDCETSPGTGFSQEAANSRYWHMTLKRKTIVKCHVAAHQLRGCSRRATDWVRAEALLKAHIEARLLYMTHPTSATLASRIPKRPHSRPLSVVPDSRPIGGSHARTVGRIAGAFRRPARAANTVSVKRGGLSYATKATAMSRGAASSSCTRAR